MDPLTPETSLLIGLACGAGVLVIIALNLAFLFMRFMASMDEAITRTTEGGGE